MLNEIIVSVFIMDKIQRHLTYLTELLIKRSCLAIVRAANPKLVCEFSMLTPLSTSIDSVLSR